MDEAVESGMWTTRMLMEVDRTNDGPAHIAVLTQDQMMGDALGMREGGASSDLYSTIADRVNEKPREFLRTPMSRAQTKKAVMTMGYAAGPTTIGEYLAEAGAVQKDKSKVRAGAEIQDVIAEAVPGFSVWGTWCKGVARMAAASHSPVVIMPDKCVKVVMKYGELVDANARTDVGRVGYKLAGPNTDTTKVAALAPNAVHTIDGLVCAKLVAGHRGTILSVYDAWLVSPWMADVVVERHKDVFIEVHTALADTQ